MQFHSLFQPVRWTALYVLMFSMIILSCSEVRQGFDSDHFQLERLSDGVWAAIHTPGGEAICNAGIVDLGDETLVFDCFLTPRAALDLKKAAESLTGNPVSYVVNSHYHNDHIRGNQIFDKSTQIISTQEISELISQHEPEEIESEKEYGPGWLAEMEHEFDTVIDTKRKNELIMWIAYAKGMLDSHGTLETVLPDTFFSGSMLLEGSERSVKLLEYHDGHTENDIVLFLDNEKILFAGDLLFVECHPYLANGDPYNLVNILEELKQLESDVIVPGHGPVGSNQNIDELINYIEQVDELGKQYLAQSKTKKDITESDIPSDFNDWLFPNFFKYNLGYMLDQSATMEENN